MQISKSSRLSGEIQVPTDKSMSHRAVFFGSVAQGVTRIKGFLKGADCISTMDCFKQMGVRFEEEKDGTIQVFGQGMHSLVKPDATLYTGNSGTTTRMLTGLLSAQPFDAAVDGDASIRKRPMTHVIDPLTQMGAAIEGTHCPLTIHGKKLHPIDFTMPVASAQLKTALLIASMYAQGTTTIREPVASRNHTELMLGCMGADIVCEEGVIQSRGVDTLNAIDIQIGADISSAAFPLVAAAIVPGSQVTVKDVNINPTRTGILEVLRDMGADLSATNVRLWNNEPIADLTVSFSALNGTDIGGDIIPRLIDEIPIIAVAAACAKGRTKIYDASQLKVKESNRIDAIVNELKKTGVDIEATDDGMIINGGNDLKAGDFRTYHDHRMAMSLGVLALVTSGDSTIENPEVVDVSFPGFFEMLKTLQR